MPRKNSCVYIFLTLLSLWGISQPRLQINAAGIPPITNYNSDDYHGYSQVWDIIQDENGLIYITTTTAIHEFDGTNWRRIETPTRSSIGRNFTINDENRIYIGGINLMGYLAHDSLGLMQFVSLFDSVPDSTSVGNIEFVKYLNKKVYFSGQRGIYIYDEISKNIAHFDTETKAYPNFIWNNQIHFHIAEKGIYTIQGDTLSLIDSSQKNTSISDISVNNREEVTLISSSEGLIRFGASESAGMNAFDDTFFKENFAYKALNLSDDYNLICFLKAGVVITDRDWNPVLHLDQNHIKDNQVHNAHLDKDQNLWLATNSGVSMIELASALSVFDESTGIEGGILDITENNGSLFVSTAAGVYTKPWRSDLNPLDSRDIQFDKISGAGIYSYDLLSTNHGVLVKAYESVGLIKNGEYTKLLEKSSQKASLALLKDSTYVITTGSNGSEIEVLQRNSTGWKHIKTIRNEVLPQTIFFLLYDTKNLRIWGANPSELFSFNISDDHNEIVNYRSYGSSSGLPSDERNWFQVIDNEVVFTTTEGLYTFDQSTEKFTKDDRFGNYFDEIGIQLIQNERSNDLTYWYTTNTPNRGIYNLQEHLATSEMTIFSKLVQSLFVSDYLGTFLGGATLDFYPRGKQDKYDFEFTPLIRSVEIITQMDSSIYQGESQKRLYVPYDQNSLRLSYSIPYYRHPEGVSYQYQLEGFDEDWSQWSAKNQKEYTNLPHGTYKFKVRAKNAFGTVSSEGGISIVIITPWYKDWWMFIIYTFLGLMLIWLIVRLNSRRLRRENERLEVVINERTKEISDQKKVIEKALVERESLLKEIHHRVKNNLQIIANLLYLQSGKVEDEDFKKILEDGQGRVRSMALIHEKLYQNEDLKSISFGEYISQLINEIKSSFGEEGAGVKVKIDAEDAYFDIDQAIPLGLIINELITNSFKYAFDGSKEGSLQVYLTKENGNYLLTIADNGKGFPDEIDIRKTKSLGLRLVRMLSNQLEGEYVFDSREGTKFSLKFVA